MKIVLLALVGLLACTRDAKVEPPPKPLAVAIVFNGQELWVGNETHETDTSAQYKGALNDLVAAFDRVQFPGGTQGLVVSYSDGVRLLHPLGPIDQIKGRTFGVQRDYRSRIGSDLVEGITVAAEMIPREMRGLIIVIGDGNDTHTDDAMMRMLELRRALTKRAIAVHALIIPSLLSPSGDVVSVLTPNARAIPSASLAAELESIVLREWAPAARGDGVVRSAGR
jgi:hypothetical protein